MYTTWEATFSGANENICSIEPTCVENSQNYFNLSFRCSQQNTKDDLSLFKKYSCNSGKSANTNLALEDQLPRIQLVGDEFLSPEPPRNQIWRPHAHAHSGSVPKARHGGDSGSKFHHIIMAMAVRTLRL
jgi:hypothetical protein